MNFDGEIAGYRIKDKIKHDNWIALVNLGEKDKIFVLELMLRPKDYVLCDSLFENMNYLVWIIKWLETLVKTFLKITGNPTCKCGIIIDG